MGGRACGRGQLNSAAFAEGNAATPKFERFEGTTTDGSREPTSWR
jgi:hypothetical protein